ncbi:hypothetical protein FOZ63_027766, partial [Perkinsus olseni]
MVPATDGSPLFALVFLRPYSTTCEATWGMTRENLRAYKTDLPTFDDLFVSKSRRRSTLKANALSEEQIDGMFKGVPTASAITSSPVMKATNSMVKLAIDESRGEQQQQLLEDRPLMLLSSLRACWSGRAGKRYSIKGGGNMAELKRLLYVGLLGADLLARNGGSAVVIDLLMCAVYGLGKLCEMLKDGSKIPNYVKAEDLGDGRAHFTVPHLLPKSILDKPVGFAPAPSTLDIRAPKGQKVTRLLTKVFPSRRVRMKRTAL